MFESKIVFSKLLLTYFLNDMLELNIPITIILDDFSMIKNSKIKNHLEFLLCHLPPKVQLVIACREYPDINLAKYRASGEILVLNSEDLTFTQVETISFFRNGSHIQLTREEYIKVNNTFEGWIAGMQLMTLASGDSGKLMIPAVSQRDFIYTYLMEEVIHKLDDTMKDFLIRTSVLECFSPELCDYLFHTVNAKKMIQKLVNLNLFLTCDDKKNGWYRYHRLFKESLVTLIPPEEDKFTLSLYLQASKWHKEKKYWKEAIHYAVKGQNFRNAVALLEAFSQETGCKGVSGLLHKWNQYLPKDMVENNLRLLLNSAWAYSAEGNTIKLSDCMNLILKFEKPSVQQQAEITALYSTNLPGPGANLDDILAKCRQVTELLAPQDYLYQLICFNIGSIFLFKGNVNDCLTYFELCYTHSRVAGNYYLAIISKKAIITSQIRKGLLHKSEQELQEFLKLLTDSAGEMIPAVGLLYAQLAEIYYQRNDLAAALQMALDGIRYGELGEDIWTAGENYLILGKIYLALNMKEEYERTQAKILKIIKGRHFFDLGIKLECCYLQSLISEGKLTSASQKISSIGSIINDKLKLVYPEFILTRVRFYIKTRAYKKAEEELLSLRTGMEITGLKGSLCEVQVVLSLIYEKMGQSNRALIELNRAVLLAGEQGNLQIFLNEGAIMKGMLNRLRLKESDFKTNLLFVDGLLYGLENQLGTETLSGELLSSREIEILDMVSQGAGNEEIADKLFVSKNTVKTHLLNIYSKLGVHSRTMAVSKAKSLNIISY